MLFSLSPQVWIKWSRVHMAVPLIPDDDSEPVSAGAAPGAAAPASEEPTEESSDEGAPEAASHSGIDLLPISESRESRAISTLWSESLGEGSVRRMSMGATRMPRVSMSTSVPDAVKAAEARMVRSVLAEFGALRDQLGLEPSSDVRRDVTRYSAQMRRPSAED